MASFKFGGKFPRGGGVFRSGFLAGHLKNAGQLERFYKIVCATWEIWRSRNRAAFHLSVPSVSACVANIDLTLSLLLKLKGVQPKEGANVKACMGDQLSFCVGTVVESGHVERLVVDAAWKKDRSLCGCCGLVL